MNRLRIALSGSFVLGFLMIPVIFSSVLAEDMGQGAGRRPSQRSHMGPGHMGPEAPWISIMLRHRSELNLTAEQVATLEQLRSDFQKQVVPQREALRDVEAEIARLLQADPMDLAQVRVKIEEVAKLRAEFRYLRIETLEKGKAVLTAEQRSKLENLNFHSHGRFRRPRA